MSYAGLWRFAVATTKKKKTVKKISSKRAQAESVPAAESSTAKLERLIAEKESAITDGSLQVALAIASITQLVIVDASTDPFSVDPEDLFELKFNDNRVGLADDDMPIFKANLAEMLPSIREDIFEGIDDNANLDIALVVDFVTLSLVSR